MSVALSGEFYRFKTTFDIEQEFYNCLITLSDQFKPNRYLSNPETLTLTTDFISSPFMQRYLVLKHGFSQVKIKWRSLETQHDLHRFLSQNNIWHTHNWGETLVMLPNDRTRALLDLYMLGVPVDMAYITDSAVLEI